MPGQQTAAAVIGSQYCAQGEQIFFVNEKWASLSGDDFNILDSNKQIVFRMDSSAFSIKQHRVLKTVKGHPVCSLKKKLLSGRQPTWYISSGSHASDKDRLAVIKKDTYNGAHSASLFLSNNTTQFFAQPIADYSARGDFGNRSFCIYHGMAPVAEIMRNFSTAEKNNWNGQSGGMGGFSSGFPGQQQQSSQGFGQQGFSQNMGSQPYGQQNYNGNQPTPGQQPFGSTGFGQQGGPSSAVVSPHYCTQTEQVFFLKEKLASLSGDDFDILDANNSPAFKMQASAVSLAEKRVLKNAQNQPVCSLKKKLMSSTGTWYISTGSSAGDKERVAIIKKDMFNNAHSASAFLQANNSQHFAQPVPDYSAQGDINNRSFFIYRGSVPVAEVMRSVSSQEKYSGKNSYALRVSPGTDCAFMIAFCITIDELFND
ncbi:hypothetical protein WJX79_007117 [Trebouxia sp. C0005]